jgi:hypothetical protein
VDQAATNLTQQDEAAIYFHTQSTMRAPDGTLLKTACHPAPGLTCPVPNSALTIERNDGLNDGVITFSWDTNSLPAGHAVTIHSYVFNDPTKCVVKDVTRNLKCSSADVNNQTPGVMGGVIRLGGQVVGADGRSSGTIEVHTGDTSFCFPDQPCNGGVQTLNSGLLFCIRDHGLAATDPVALQKQLNTWQPALGSAAHFEQYNYTLAPHLPNGDNPPQARCKDVTVSAEDNACSATASINDGSNASIGLYNCTQSESSFGLGTTLATLTCTDLSGNLASCTANVTVVDTTPPIVSTKGDADGFIGSLWPPNKSFSTFTIDDCIAQAADQCDGSNLQKRIIGVSSDETAGNPKKTGAGDIVLVDDTTVQVRADRDGGGDGRVYTLYAAVSDDAGNTTTVSCRVGVPHDQSGAAPVDSGAAYCEGTCE